VKAKFSLPKNIHKTHEYFIQVEYDVNKLGLGDNPIIEFRFDGALSYGNCYFSLVGIDANGCGV
jgi:hypothetical protein